jgi:hypothetical protein
MKKGWFVMKVISRFKKNLQGLIDAVVRFPFTTIFLMAVASVNALAIQSSREDYIKLIVTFVVGAFLGATAQLIYERFFGRTLHKWILGFISVLIALGYYIIIKDLPRFSMELGIKTSVSVFALLIAFIWIPSIKAKYTFNDTFLAVFKGFFIALFFAVVTWGGMSLILGATDELLFSINSKLYSHTANIIFTLFAPIYFLSMIPRYQHVGILTEDAKMHNEEEIQKAILCPKYLEILISYIIVPLTAVFTIILLSYIMINIRASFWENNLLEPMLVSYSIIVILIYILSSNLQNKFAITFKKIFPKMLIPIVFFQVMASILKIGDLGITHGRYYVILYGIFALIAGIIFSIFSVKKNGWIALVLIVFSLVSIMPPVDAFSISKASQISVLKDVLDRNNMIVENQIIPNSAISKADQKIITSTAEYISMMEYANQIEWLRDDFRVYEHFEETFGFSAYERIEGPKSQYYHYERDENININISGYDFFVNANTFAYQNEDDGEAISIFSETGAIFKIFKSEGEKYSQIEFYDERGNLMIAYHLREVFERYQNDTAIDKLLPLEEATFIKENDQVEMKLVVNFVDYYLDGKEENFNANFYVFIRIKE